MQSQLHAGRRSLILLTRCRQVSVQWSYSLEQLYRKDASRSSNDAERIINLLYINSLIVLTFACVDEHPPEVNEEDLSVMLRARAIMYQQRHATRDEERLISSEKFSKDLPQPLVDKFSFWMTCRGPKLHIELRRPTTQRSSLRDHGKISSKVPATRWRCWA